MNEKTIGKMIANDMERDELLKMREPVTNAEVFCARVLEEEMRAAGKKPTDRSWKIITITAARAMAAHRYEVRDMFRRSKGMLRQWILEQSGFKGISQMEKMKRMGLTGDIMEDMKKMEGVMK